MPTSSNHTEVSVHCCHGQAHSSEFVNFIVRPRILTYGSENWSLARKDENMLRIFERRILNNYGEIEGKR
jgi:hypothetical protein